MAVVALVLCPGTGRGQVDGEAETGHAAAAESIARILLGYRAEYRFPSAEDGWGLVVGRFSKGDEKAVEFSADVGEEYRLIGFGLEDADVDIRLFDPQGTLIDENVLDDYVPVVVFTAEFRGVYRAVMSAAAVTGGSSYAGMAILRPPESDGSRRDGQRDRP